MGLIQLFFKYFVTKFFPQQTTQRRMCVWEGEGGLRSDKGQPIPIRGENKTVSVPPLSTIANA